MRIVIEKRPQSDFQRAPNRVQNASKIVKTRLLFDKMPPCDELGSNIARLEDFFGRHGRTFHGA